MHRIFQEDPGVFSRTFRKLGYAFAEPEEVNLLTPDLTETKPLERRLDSLLRFDTANDGSYLLAVESQRRKDPDKHGSWAYYLGYLYAKYRIPPVLLVVCHDAGTARWAETPFHLGLPQWRSLSLRPLVLGPHNVPPVTDPETAAQDIPLATFAAITHGYDPDADRMLRALATALKTVDEDTATVFRELTELGLDKSPAAQIWRNLMAIDLSFFRSETSQKLRAEGRTEGRTEGLTEGRAEGHAERGAKDLLLVFQTRGIDVDDTTRQRITDCTDPDLLSIWLQRAITVSRAADVFSE
ncbi:hypothetical protein [Streptomyces sp. TS71-3]|uniref:hypothetical protein n=1 Tax=Streptomyces sp. TS71-3 TaxID=2733862 RepID=UPI001B290D39|nr:hypothetical protein [Streptomyces sp. TS71-3]GHJ34943.1 hypothetical protein Sm713_05520 [Streptomyces sp. TS71-3]